VEVFPPLAPLPFLRLGRTVARPPPHFSTANHVELQESWLRPQVLPLARTRLPPIIRIRRSLCPHPSSTQFLNHFSALSEEKLTEVSRNISKLEKVLVLLETKLNRPDADDASGAGAGASAPAVTADLPSVASLPSVAPSAAAAAPSADATTGHSHPCFAGR
jgi:hypothetical protein